MSFIAEISPPHLTGNLFFDWLLAILAICLIGYGVCWGCTKIAGPPNLPTPIKWVIWVFAFIVIVYVVFKILGIPIP